MLPGQLGRPASGTCPAATRLPFGASVVLDGEARDSEELWLGDCVAVATHTLRVEAVLIGEQHRATSRRGVFEFAVFPGGVTRVAIEPAAQDAALAFTRTFEPTDAVASVAALATLELPEPPGPEAASRRAYLDALSGALTAHLVAVGRVEDNARGTGDLVLVTAAREHRERAGSLREQFDALVRADGSVAFPQAEAIAAALDEEVRAAAAMIAVTYTCPLWTPAASDAVPSRGGVATSRLPSRTRSSSRSGYT